MSKSLLGYVRWFVFDSKILNWSQVNKCILVLVFYLFIRALWISWKGFTLLTPEVQQFVNLETLYFHLNMSADDDGFIGNVKTVKRMIGGSGKAEKDDVADGVRRILKLPADFEFKSDDASDAAAIGLAFAIENGLIKGVDAE